MVGKRICCRFESLLFAPIILSPPPRKLRVVVAAAAATASGQAGCGQQCSGGSVRLAENSSTIGREITCSHTAGRAWQSVQIFMVTNRQVQDSFCFPSSSFGSRKHELLPRRLGTHAFNGGETIRHPQLISAANHGDSSAGQVGALHSSLRWPVAVCVCVCVWKANEIHVAIVSKCFCSGSQAHEVISHPHSGACSRLVTKLFHAALVVGSPWPPWPPPPPT